MIKIEKQDVMSWTLAAVFVFTAIITALSLIGIVRFDDKKQQEELFWVLIVEVSMAGIYFFKKDILNQPSTQVKKPDSSVIIQANDKKPLINENKYYIGIDLGRSTIKYCMLRYEIKDGEKSFKRIFPGEKSTPVDGQKNSFDNVISEILQELFDNIDKDEKEYRVEGIGFGLPGQVDPKEGKILNFPGGDILADYSFYKKYNVKSSLMTKLGCNSIPIAIDNDVRCATRYLWKKNDLTDAICIVSGKGLGSGLILDNKIRYGSSFTAGEIGHTTISGCFSRDCNEVEDNYKCFHTILAGQDEKSCMCKINAFHLETLVSGEGMLKIARNLNPFKYKEMTRKMKENGCNDLLRHKEFSGYKEKIASTLDILTTYYLSLAFYEDDEYATEIVKCFNEYLAIGIANYINIVNPDYVYLDGGMARGFYKLNRMNSRIGQYTHKLLEKRIREYVLPSTALKLEQNFVRIIEENENGEKAQIASMGAALIFTDDTYKKYIGGEYHNCPIF